MTWLISILIVGAIAGFLAGKIIKGDGFGVLGNMVIGVIGSLVGGVVCWFLPFSFGDRIIGRVIISTIGALLFLVGYGWYNKSKT